MSELKKFWLVILTIATVLTFSLSPLPDLIHGIGQTAAPWRHRTEADLIRDLRMEIFDLQVINSYFAQENRYLRKLVYTTKPDMWTTWLELLDEIKRLENVNEELRDIIRELENKLELRQDQLAPSPYRQI